MPSNTAQRVVDLIRTRGPMTTRELRALGIHSQTLVRLVDQGAIERRGRGLYGPLTEEATVVSSTLEACRRYPKAVLGLVSALNAHELTTQAPREVWLLIPSRGHIPRWSDLPVKFVCANTLGMTLGVITQTIRGVAAGTGGHTIRVTSPARTVVDCYRYARHVPRAVADEALHDALRQRKATPAEIDELAKALRIRSVIAPRLEAMLA